MAERHSDELKRHAVRIALTSGLTRCQVASDHGIGFSTLVKWGRTASDQAQVPERDTHLLRKNEGLRKENRMLREEREVLKKATVDSTGQRNDLIKDITWRLEAKRFPRPRIAPEGNLIDVALSVSGQVRLVQEVLSQKAILVFVAAALPRALGIKEVDADICGDGQLAVISKFGYPGHRSATPSRPAAAAAGE